VIKNPVESHLPTGCVKIATSFHADLVDVRELVPTSAPLVFVVGAMSHGSVSGMLFVCILLRWWGGEEISYCPHITVKSH